MINYTTTNNASWLLLSSLWASGTTAILQIGQGALFPATYPFLLTIEKIVATVVTQREIVKVTNKTGDNFTIVRSQGTCPPSDSSNTPWTTAFSFDAWDRVSQYIPAEVIQDLYTWIVALWTSKLNVAWQLRTWNGAWKVVYNDWSWDETELALWTAWKVLTSNWATSAPTFETPTVDIGWLSAIINLSSTDEFIINQGGNKKITKDNLEKNLILDFWDASDWNVTITTSVTLTRDMYYNNLTINNPWVLDTAWYKVFVAWTLSWTWTIRRNGNIWNNWVDWWSSGTWWTWWAVLNQWTLWLSYWWINWGNGVSWYLNYWNSTTWNTIINTYKTLASNCKWWNWWDCAGIWKQWTGWINVLTKWYLSDKSLIENYKYVALWYTSQALYNVIGWWIWWASWCPWSGGNTGWGWWWGWSWGIIFIYANIFNFSWVIESKWLNWWSAGNATSTVANANVTWWSGWWSWWSGWILYVITNSFTNWWTINLSGWNGWVGWNASLAAWSEPWNGWDGWAWWDWGIVVIQSPNITLWTITYNWWTGWNGWTWVWSGWVSWQTGATGNVWNTIQISV